jgi:osmotically-inducible protein OsmY
VPDERIRSTISDGWVKLEGTVDEYREREDAERAVRYLLGVRGVRNLIAVKPKLSPQDVQQLIEEALERRAERKAGRIKVAVKDGVVSLNGAVQSWSEKQAIIGAVSHTPGVQQVEDHLRLEPWAAFA